MLSVFPMAEVSDFHRATPRRQQQQQRPRPISNTIPMAHQQQEYDDEFHQHSSFVLDVDSFSPPTNSDSSFFVPDNYTNSFDFGFDLNAEARNLGSDYADSLADPSCYCFGGGEEENNEPMSYVTDLFQSREAHVLEDPIWEFDVGHAEDPDMEFGFGPDLRSAEVPSDVGLRVVGTDSESDSEEFEVNSWLINNNENNYDSFGANHYRISENEREQFEWEEVSEIIHFDERENLDSVIDRIEGFLISSNLSSLEGENLQLREIEEVEEGEEEELEEEEGNIEWEVLLRMNNLDGNFEFDNSEEYSDESEVPNFNLPDDYILTMEQGTIFGQPLENENAVKSGRPASKTVVENLPSVVLTKEEVGECNNAAVCTVCKDDFVAGEKVTRMPCFHLYHRDCILPWLEIRNTCPVCRFELPTDNADHEKMRINREQ